VRSNKKKNRISDDACLPQVGIPNDEVLTRVEKIKIDKN